MGAIEKFSTAAVTPAERLAFWNQVCGDTLERTCVDSGIRGFRAEMWRWTLDGLTLVRPRSDASVVRRGPSGPGGETVVIHFQQHGFSRFSQGGRSADLAAGEFILSDAAEGYCFELSPDHELLVLEMPRAPLADRLPGLDDRLCRSLAGGSQAGLVFRDFLLSLWRNGDQSAADPDWQQGICNVVFDLAALAVNGSAQPAPLAATRRDAFRDRLLALVEARLCDPELRTAEMAAALGVSPRTVQNAFAQLSTTPSGHVQERRLQRAADRLRAEPGTRITDIAFELGFNDSAYFARCFRRRFGVSPSDWRGAPAG